MKEVQTRVVSELIGDFDAEFLEDNFSNIQSVWDKRQLYRTETEMRVSVLNDIKFPTIAAKYWQCVREMSVFYQNLVTLSFDYRRNKIKQVMKEKEIKDNFGPKRELLEIDLDEMKFAQSNMRHTAKDRMREIKLWLTIMQECVEDDPTFDTHNVNTHQLNSYVQRFKAQIENIGNASPSEKANLMGQYETARRHIDEQIKINGESHADCIR